MKPTEHSRRDFIQQLAYSTLGVTFLANEGLANIPSTGTNTRFGKAKHCIYVYLDGGISHTDFLDPKTDPEINCGVPALRTSGDFEISGYFPELARHGNKFTAIRSMNSTSGAHAISKYNVRTSYTKSSLIIHPTMGSLSYWLLGKQHGSIPDNVLISGDNDHPRGGYLGKEFYPVSIINPNEGLRFSKANASDTVFNKRLEILKSFDNGFHKKFNTPDVNSYSTIYDEALKLMKSKDLDLFDLNKEEPATRERYGKGQIGSALLLAKRLVKNNVRYVEVNNGGYDMHVDIKDNMEKRGAELDKALGALFDDLDKEGLLNSTLVVVATDFGRTPKINKNEGKDHFPAAFSMLLGGLNLGGKVIGKTNATGEKIEETPVSVGEFNATVGYLLGITSDKIWMTPPDSSAPNRPMSIGNGKQPIAGLI